MNNKGFTLIEIIVATALFVVVMLVAVTAVLGAVDANRRSQAMNVVINNLNLAVESMVRDIRTGRAYTDCAGDCIAFKDKEGRDVEYRIVTDGTDTYLDKQYTETGVSPVGEGRLTSEEVVIEDMTFDIMGDGDNDGPERMLLHMNGVAGTGKYRSEFNIQTLITSRILDITEF